MTEILSQGLEMVISVMRYNKASPIDSEEAEFAAGLKIQSDKLIRRH